MELSLFLVLSVLLFRALGRGSPGPRPVRPRTDTWLDAVVDGAVQLTGDVVRGARTLLRLDAQRRDRRGSSPWS